MKRITFMICSFFFSVFIFRVSAQDADAMKAWQDYMTPGEMHKMMATWDGSWTGEVSMWMSPDTPPMKSTSSAVNKMSMNGLYQISNHKGSFSGMPFEGMSTLAFDKHRKEFESIWIDNMGSGIMHLRGPWDPATKTITLKGKMIDPLSGKEVEVKETFKVVDDNTQVMEMFAPGPDGKEFKTMQITFKRSN